MQKILNEFKYFASDKNSSDGLEAKEEETDTNFSFQKTLLSPLLLLSSLSKCRIIEGSPLTHGRKKPSLYLCTKSTSSYGGRSSLPLHHMVVVIIEL